MHFREEVTSEASSLELNYDLIIYHEYRSIYQQLAFPVSFYHCPLSWVYLIVVSLI
jgi:hypothetical protein